MILTHIHCSCIFTQAKTAENNMVLSLYHFPQISPLTFKLLFHNFAFVRFHKTEPSWTNLASNIILLAKNSEWWLFSNVSIIHVFEQAVKRCTLSAEYLVLKQSRVDAVWQKAIKMNLYLIGSDRKQRPQARRAFCQRLRAAMALLNVTGIGRSPRWNLQKGTRPA